MIRFQDAWGDLPLHDLPPEIIHLWGILLNPMTDRVEALRLIAVSDSRNEVEELLSVTSEQWNRRNFQERPAAMSTDRVVDLSDEQCREIAGMSVANHIWLNAFSCINPTEEFVYSVGKTVLAWLDQKDNMLPARADHESEMAALTPTLYLSVNKS